MPAPKDPIKYKEWKEKIRRPLIGRPISEKMRKNLIRRNKTYKMTEEHKKRLKECHIGKKPWNWKGGLTKEEQAGRPRPNNCEICEVVVGQRKGGICFDHDHATGKFRGWICANCNFILGHSHDNIEVLKKIIIYLENQQK